MEWMDHQLDVEIQWDRLVAWVATILPQYSIQTLWRMKIHKFYRVRAEAEEKQKHDLKKLRR